jgi:hypothetical protein
MNAGYMWAAYGAIALILAGYLAALAVRVARLERGHDDDGNGEPQP